MHVSSVICLILASVVIVPAAQENPTAAARRMAFDQILDLYVRDGLVYYRALKSDRAKLDAFVAWVGDTPMDAASRASPSGSTPTMRSCSRPWSIITRFRDVHRSTPIAASGRFPARSSGCRI